MSYRDWQRKQKNAPSRMQDLVRDRRRVRLLERVTTNGGEVFEKGEVLYVRGIYRSTLHLEDEHRTRYLRMVPLRVVKMADELLLFQVPLSPLKTRLKEET